MISGGYNLRWKRCKLLNEDNENYCEYYYHEKIRHKWKTPIMHLPTEVLLIILKYITFEDLARNIRLVNRRFKVIAEYILNKSFLDLEQQLEHRRSEAILKLNYCTNPKELRGCCKLLNAMEILIFHYNMIMATVWRYIRIPQAKLCMYGGEILDSYALVLQKLLKRPRSLYILHNTRHYGAFPVIIVHLNRMSKMFCEHFENVSEMPINSVFISGAKLVDILDTDNYAVRTCYAEDLKGSTCYCRLCYQFDYCWFAADRASETVPQTMHWKKHQKYMYMRLRRLVMAHTKAQMNLFQYLREQQELQNTLFVVPRPRPFCYTACGEEETDFLCYGAMNQEYYDTKYPTGTFNLGVQIWVTVKCPFQLAPLRMLKDIKRMQSNKTLRGSIEIKLKIISPGNHEVGLADEYSFTIKENRK